MMSMTLAVSDHLADLLHTLAAQRGMLAEELGEQALAVGLTTLTSSATADIVDIGAVLPGAHERNATLSVRSPIIVNGSVRPLLVTFEPNPATPTDAD